MLCSIYVVVAIFQKFYTKPLIYLLLRWEQGDSTSLRGTSVASMTFGQSPDSRIYLKYEIRNNLET